MSLDPKQKPPTGRLAEIEREIDGLVHSNFRLEDEADRLGDLPRGTAMRQAEIEQELRSNRERIKELEIEKAGAQSGGSADPAKA